MTRAVLLHGKSDRDEYFEPTRWSGNNGHWVPWLQQQLRSRGFNAQTPFVVDNYAPEWSKWQKEFERHLDPAPMVLVGHSCGGGFLMRWLSEHPEQPVDTLVLVAPWLDPDATLGNDFFDFTIDSTLGERVRNFHVFHSNDDEPDQHVSLKMITDALGSQPQLHIYENMGHFCLQDMGTVEFPDLLDAVVS